jgi:hypothetical protein
MSHVDEGLLHAWLDGAIPPTDDPHDEISAHLALCADCRARLEGARLLKDRANGVLRSARSGMVVPAADFASVVARAAVRRRAEEQTADTVADSSAAPVPAARQVVTGRRPAMPLAWAASVALALAAGWLGRDLVFGGPDTGPERVVTDEAAPSRVAAGERAAGSAETAGVPGARADAGVAPAADEEAVREQASPTRPPAAAEAVPPRAMLATAPAALVDAVGPDAAGSRLDAPAALASAAETSPPLAAARIDERITSDAAAGTPVPTSGANAAAPSVGRYAAAPGGVPLADASSGLPSARQALTSGFDEGRPRGTLQTAGERGTTLSFGSLIGRNQRAVTSASPVAPAWRPATIDEAGRRFGGPVLHVTGLPVNGVWVVEEGSLWSVRVAQAATGGTELTLVQWRDTPPRRNAAAGAESARAPLPAATLLRTSSRADGMHTAIFSLADGSRISLTGKLPLDELAGLAPRLAPVEE